jgi:hypothetical protein
MNKTRSKYQVHAEVLRTGTAPEAFDDAEAVQTIERRMNRLERVAAAYRGRIDLRFNNVMLMTFETADAALLGACEMQHRCAVLPQASRQRLALRIGIHKGLIRQRSIDAADNTRDVASQLAVVDDGIVASDIVVSDLNQDLRKITRPLGDPAVEIAAHKVDWRCEIPSAAYGGESFWPASMAPHPIGPYLLLHYGMKTLELSEENPVLTIGRDPLSDLVMVSIHVSRNHCRIERHADGIVLADSSTNGTCVKTDDGVELLVRQSSVNLKGKGLLFFGRPYNGERRGGVRYESY